MTSQSKYYEWHPVDGAILAALPREGEVLGYHVIATTVKGLLTKLNAGVPPEGQIASEQLTARLRSMLASGFVVAVPVFGTGGVRGWQRTPAGESLYRKEVGASLVGNLRSVEGGAA